MTHLALFLLGSFQAKLNHESVAQFEYDKMRALLAYLALEAQDPQRRDALAGFLWPERPEDAARHNLRQALSNLRRLLQDNQSPTPFLHLTREAVHFPDSSQAWFDVRLFDSLLEACRHHDHLHVEACTTCVDRLQQAIDLYRGEFLEGFFLDDSSAFEEWVEKKRRHYHRQMLGALRTLAVFYERQGQYERSLALAWRELGMEAWREETHRHIMHTLALSGQRDAALAHFETCRRVLSDELGVSPSKETVALYDCIRAEETPSQRTWSVAEPSWPVSTVQPMAPRGLALPAQLTPFIGRASELAMLTKRLHDPACRLLTLVGPGGVGKTRLALELATQQASHFRDGVFVAPLVSLQSPAHLVVTLADVLQLVFYGHELPEAQLLNYLRDKQMLLVLDNFEHLVEAGSFIIQMLHAAPGLRIVVTSQERLQLQAEWIFDVDGMQIPNGHLNGATQDYDAVRLFVARASQIRAGFALTDQVKAPIVRICRQVHGIPLGIELAAAWARDFSCAEIAERIERSLDFLHTAMRDVPIRHRSLRAVFDHTWKLLTPEEQRTVRRLAVFEGTISEQAALSVTGATPAVLTALAAKSLLYSSGRERYGLHQLVRYYAQEKFNEAADEKDMVRERYASYVARFMAKQEPLLLGSQQKQALDDINAELDNVGAMWRWAIAGRRDRMIDQALESLFRFFEVRSWFVRGSELFEETVRVWSSGTPAAARSDVTLLLGRLQIRLGILLGRLSHDARARTLLESGLMIVRQANNKREMAFALTHLGQLVGAGGDLAAAIHLLDESLAVAPILGDRSCLAAALHHRGVAAHLDGDETKAQEMLRRSLKIRQEAGDMQGVASALGALGRFSADQGDFVTARQRLNESLLVSRELGNPYEMTAALDQLGLLASSSGDYAMAATFYRECLSVARQIGQRTAILLALSGLGEIACAQGEYSRASASLQAALRIGVEIQAMPRILSILVGMANLALQRGALEQVVALVTFPLHHRASSVATRTRASGLLSELTDRLPPETLRACEARSHQQGLPALVSALLAESKE